MLRLQGSDRRLGIEIVTGEPCRTLPTTPWHSSCVPLESRPLMWLRRDAMVERTTLLHHGQRSFGSQLDPERMGVA
jgi:hypothetical protein